MEKVTKSMKIVKGPVNGVFIERGRKLLVVYGDPSGSDAKADIVLFTHFRRDVTWAGIKLLDSGARGVAPDGEKAYFISADSVINRIPEARFHDYYCQTTRFPVKSLNISRFVAEGDVISWEGIDFMVLYSPGYTRNAVSYLAKIDGMKVAFTGDLIYGNGQLIDIYSLQDSYQSTGGYHGYASRLGDLIASLQLVRDWKPDIIIPSRGPVIYDPVSAIDSLTERIRGIYRNYLSISALKWYFPDRMPGLAEHVLGPGIAVGPMKYADIIRYDRPVWCRQISNSNLVIAEDSSAFVIDCGTRDAYRRVMELVNSGRIKTIEGVFITHYHDDHTEYINDIAGKFNCPVYAIEELKDILKNPGAYRLPCLTTRPVNKLTVKKDGDRMSWKDFELTFYYFPGQTFYHDAILFRKKGGESVFFIGDSFTPSGIDDYCLLNRNLLHEGQGYFYCLDILEKMPQGILLANQHVEPLFSFSAEQLDFMKLKLAERNKLFGELFPWDDINYGIDEQWIAAYPYVQNAVSGRSMEISLRLTNHSVQKQTFYVIANPHGDLLCKNRKVKASIEPGATETFDFEAEIKEKAASGVKIVTFDVGSDGMEFKDFCEAFIISEHK